jgi:hypothetical protein
VIGTGFCLLLEKGNQKNKKNYVEILDKSLPVAISGNAIDHFGRW